VDDYVKVAEVFADAVKKQRKDLETALRRRNRAAKSLKEADSDIAAISGALMALESVWRQLRIESGDAEELPAPPPSPQQIVYQTLAGNVSLYPDVNSLTSQPNEFPPQ